MAKLDDIFVEDVQDSQARDPTRHQNLIHVVSGREESGSMFASSLPTEVLDIQVDQVALTPSSIKESILNHNVVAKIAPILFLIGGLPDSKKTTAIRQTMAALTGEIPEYFEEWNINNYNSSAVQKFSELKFKNFPTKIQGYSKVIHAALENDTRTKGEILLCGNEVEFNIKLASLAQWFTDDRLNKRFKEVSKDLYGLTNKLTLQRVRNHVEISRPVSEWDKSFTSGMALIKVWDIGFNKVSMYILPLLAGHLTNSHLWMFLDLMRDVDKLYMPPDLPMNRFDESRNDDRIMLRWRARIHYLLRFAKLASSILEKRKNVCQVIASVTSKVPSDDIADKIEQLRRSVESAAKQMEVGHLIDTKKVIEFKALDAACTEALEEAFKDVVRHQLKNICEVPLSFLFLRSAFYDADLYYINKSDLREVAIKELNFTPESFEKFCSVFSSFASIIDLDLITPSSDLIILQPFRFINELDKLFYPTPDDDTSVLITKYGIVTESAAKRIFGADASSVYMKFLESVNLAVRLPSCKFDKSLDDPYAYYLPNARNSPATDLQKKCNPTSLHLFRNLSRPTLHLQVLFTKVLLQDDSFMLDMSSTHEPCNIMTRFKAINEGIVFDFVYLGDAIEFRFPNDDATPEICRKIIVVCKEILPEDIKYNFAIMCQSEDTNDADTLQNSRHLFPLKGSCKKCSISLDTATDAVKMWNSVIEEETVPDKQKLNGAPLTNNIDQTKSPCVNMVELCELKSKTKNVGVQVDYCHLINRLENLNGIHIAGKKLFVVQGNSAQSINWEEYGLRIGIMEGSLPASETAEIAVIALVGGQFEFPKKTQLVSAVYAILLSKPLNEPLRLDMQHCIKLVSQSQTKYMTFAIAPIYTPGLYIHVPYKFKVVEGGEFTVNSFYGSIHRQEFCLVCELAIETEQEQNGSTGSSNEDGTSSNNHTNDDPGDDDDDPGEDDDDPGEDDDDPGEDDDDPGEDDDDDDHYDQQNADSATFISAEQKCYAGILFNENRRDLSRFCVFNCLNALRTYIKNEYPQADIDEEVLFQFNPKFDYIELIFDDKRQVYPCTGWIVRPLRKCCKLLRIFVDYFGNQSSIPISLAISVYCTNEPGSVEVLDYGILLEGIEPETTLFIHRTKASLSNRSLSIEATNTLIIPSSSSSTRNQQVIQLISILRNRLRENESILRPIFESFRKEIAHHMHQNDIISNADSNAPTFNRIIESFELALPTKKTLPDLEAYCIKFLKALKDAGGSAMHAAEMLLKEWKEQVNIQLSIDLKLSI